MKLAVFDFDSTLIDGETFDIISFPTQESKDRYDSIVNLEVKCNNFFDSLIKRVECLENKSYHQFRSECNNVKITKNAKQIINYLKLLGYMVIVMSGGFDEAIEPVCEHLGIDIYFCNHLETMYSETLNEVVLTGKVGGEMMSDKSKGDLLQKIMGLCNMHKDDIIVFGDGTNDISMFNPDLAGIRVAVQANETLKEHSNCILDRRDFSLEYLEKMGLIHILKA